MVADPGSARTRRRWPLVVLLTSLAGIAIAVVGAVVYLRPVAPIATGYAAKAVCSEHFLARATVADAVEDLPANPLVPLLRAHVGDDEVTASLLGARPSTAYFTPGRGCTLSSRGRPDFPPLPAPSPSGSWPRSDTQDAGLEEAIDEAFGDDPADGVTRRTRAVLVVHDGRIVAERYGERFGARSRMLGWSMTKSIANAMVGVLVGEGRLALDDDGVVPGPDDGRDAITVEHLLHMTPGLAFEEVYDPPSDVTQMLFASDDTAVRAASEPMVAEPGTTFHYSSGTTNILCDVIQTRLGGDLESAAFARDAVFEPLGMTTAVLQPDASGGMVCSSSAYASARDWARFGQLYLDDGVWGGERLLPEGWVDYTTTPAEAATGHGYGAHWWLNTNARGDVRMPELPGDTFWAAGNSGQNLVVVPSHDLVVVRLGLDAGYESSVDWGMEQLVAAAVAAVEAAEDAE